MLIDLQYVIFSQTLDNCIIFYLVIILIILSMSTLVFADSVDCNGPWLTGTQGYWGAETRRPGGQCNTGFAGSIDFSDIWVIWVVSRLIHQSPVDW